MKIHRVNKLKVKLIIKITFAFLADDGINFFFKCKQLFAFFFIHCHLSLITLVQY